jgi:hypothetical protein
MNAVVAQKILFLLEEGEEVEENSSKLKVSPLCVARVIQEFQAREHTRMTVNGRAPEKDSGRAWRHTFYLGGNP